MEEELNKLMSEKKNNEADKKLKQMMIDKQEAEKKKVDSEELKKILKVNNFFSYFF